MADVTFSGISTPANKANVVIKSAGGSISKHDWVYIDTANNGVVKQAQADGTELEGTVYGMALHAASSGEFVLIAIHGAVVMVGGGLTANTRYVLSETAGATAPQGDLTSDSYISEVCFALSTTSLKIDINNTGNQVA